MIFISIKVIENPQMSLEGDLTNKFSTVENVLGNKLVLQVQWNMKIGKKGENSYWYIFKYI